MLFSSLPWYLPPVIIFFSRILDVSVGTIRIVSIAQGRKGLATVLGFVESLIWLIVISQIMQNLTGWPCYVGYAAGYAAGNYVGLLIEERLAMGTVQLRLTTTLDHAPLMDALRDRGFGVTANEAIGSTGRAVCLVSVLRRRDLPRAVEVVRAHLPNAFYTVEDLRHANAGVFPLAAPAFPGRLLASRRRA